MSVIPQSVRRATTQATEEEADKRSCLCFLRRIFKSKTKNGPNQRDSSVPGSPPTPPHCFLQSRKVLRLYEISYHLQTGCDSEIYAGKRTKDSQKVAIKVSENSQACEAQKYRVLLDDDEPVGVPFIYSYGWCEISKKTYLITSFLGPSLHDILERLRDKVMKVKDVCMIAVRALACLQYFHSKGIIHGDINPRNILMGRLEKSGEVFLIDYKSLQPWNRHGKRFPCEERTNILRNSHYTSPRSCSSRVLTRRDDMVSLSYTVIQLLQGALPWIKSDEILGSLKVDRMKVQVGKGLSVCAELPKEIADFTTRVHTLEFTERPDYSSLSEYFRACLRRIDETDDSVYQWSDDPYITC